jgi:hypothetical protein
MALQGSSYLLTESDEERKSLNRMSNVIERLAYLVAL